MVDAVSPRHVPADVVEADSDVSTKSSDPVLVSRPLAPTKTQPTITLQFPSRVIVGSARVKAMLLLPIREGYPPGRRRPSGSLPE